MPSTHHPPPSPPSSLTSVSSSSSVERKIISESPLLPKPKGTITPVTVKVYPAFKPKDLRRPAPTIVTEAKAKKVDGKFNKKRKGNADDAALAPEPRHFKRLRTPSEPVSRASSSRSSSRAPSPSPVYRGSRSRSTSTLYHDFPDVADCKRNWCFGDAYIADDRTEGSQKVVAGLLKKYKTCKCTQLMHSPCCNPSADFKNPNDPEDKEFELILSDDPDVPSKYPVVELEYPNRGASEK